MRQATSWEVPPALTLSGMALRIERAERAEVGRKSPVMAGGWNRESAARGRENAAHARKE